MKERSLEALGKQFYTFKKEAQEGDLFLLGIAVVVRNCCQPEDEIDAPGRVGSKMLQRNELELLA